MTEKNVGENPLDRILSDSNKKINDTQSSAGGLLAKWWRTIMHDLHYSTITFSEKLSHFLELEFPGNNKISASNARGSYHKKFASPEFTWKVFLEGLKVIGVWKIEFSMKLYHIDGKETIHTVNALLMNQDDKEKYREKWDKYHGVNTVDEETIHMLEEQRRQVIQANAERIHEKTNKGSNYYDQVLQRIQSKECNVSDPDNN